MCLIQIWHASAAAFALLQLKFCDCSVNVICDAPVGELQPDKLSADIW